MRKTLSLLAAGTALAGAAALAAPAHADAPATVTSCSNWKLHVDRYLQACVDVTGTQVHSYGFISSAGVTPARADEVAVTGGGYPWGAGFGTQAATVTVAGDTVRFEGVTTTLAAGTRFRSTVYLPNTVGTGTIIGPDGATYTDPNVPAGPAGPPGSPASVTEQITVFASVIG